MCYKDLVVSPSYLNLLADIKYLHMNVYEQIYQFRGYGLRFYLYFLSYHTHHYQNCFI